MSIASTRPTCFVPTITSRCELMVSTIGLIYGTRLVSLILLNSLLGNILLQKKQNGKIIYDSSTVRQNT